MLNVFKKLKSSLHVLSDNPQYRRQITNEEMDMLHVCGKVLLSQS
jgi:phage repressor protein C with HTH and peptisase S24 domain